MGPKLSVGMENLADIKAGLVAANEMKMKNDFIDVATVRCISEL